MQRMTSLLFAILLFMVAWSGCSNNGVIPDTPPKTITTTVAGQVIDEFGKPIQDARITVYGKSAVTNQYGTFLIKDVTSPEERTLITVSKNGYLDGFSAEKPIVGGITQVRTGLMGNFPQGIFPSSTGYTATAFFDNATVVFPPNAYITESGEAYTGDIGYLIRQLNPTSANFYDFFAGDFQGLRTDGSVTHIFSYGVLRIELYGSKGEKLNLAAGKAAVLSFPIADQMEAIAPPEMPLWSFDEAKGMWKEDGKAVMQGNVYVGTVSHFSNWNCGVPRQTATLGVRITCGNEGVAGILVRIGERTAITDANGYAWRPVPEGFIFTIRVHSETNDWLESNEISAGPYVAGTTTEVEVPLTKCPSYIKGVLYDCGNNPIVGTVIAEYANGGFAFSFVDKGNFRLRTKTGTGMILKAFTPEGKESEPFIVPSLLPIQVYDIGIFNVCQSPAEPTTTDFDVQADVPTASKTPVDKVLITADGSRAFVFYDGSVAIINTATGAIIRTITYSTTQKVDSLYGKNTGQDISADGSLILVGIDFNKSALYDANSGTKLGEFDGYLEMSLSPDGKTLVGYKYSNQSYTLATLNASTGEIIRESTSNTITGRPKVSYPLLADFLTENTFVMVTDNILTIIRYDDLSVLHTISSNTLPSVFQSWDGSVFSTLSNGGTLSFYNAQTSVKLNSSKQSLSNLGIAPSNDRYVTQLYQNGKYAAPSIFTIAAGQLVKSLPATANIRYYGLQYSADGKKLAGAYVENNRIKLRLWNF